MSATGTDDTSRPDWVGQDALRWVIDDAPVPVDLAWTLTVIARKCDKHGKGSFQSKQTLAEKTGKSEDQVSRDIKELLKRGLIRLGDQTLPAQRGYRPGQWPTVYDVVMELKGPKPSRRSKNPTGRKKATEPEQTPRMDAGGGMDTGGGMHAPGTPRMDADPTPRMDAPQRSPSKNPSNNPSSLSARTSLPAPHDPDDDRERDDTTTSEEPNPDGPLQRLVIKHGAPPHLATQVVEYIEATNTIDGIGWWFTADRNGSLALQVATAVAALTKPIGSEPGADDPAQCPKCGDTGKVTIRLVYEGDGERTIDCDACTNDGRGNCRIHPGYRSRRCAGCRGDRIAVQDHQGRRSEPENANARNARGWMSLPTGPPEQPTIEASPNL